MRLDLDGLEVVFPYDYMYDEQLQYMKHLKNILDAKGHGLLESPTGTGKTISLLSLLLSYKAAHPNTVGKIIYCTRTVPEMTKCVAELKNLVEFRQTYYNNCPPPPPSSSSNENSKMSQSKTELLAVCLSSRRNMCVHPQVMANADGETVDSLCRAKTASWVRAKVKEDHGGSNATAAAAAAAASSLLCDYYENFDRRGTDIDIPSGVYGIEDLKRLGQIKHWCPYFLTRHVLAMADVVVYNYQYMIDPKVAGMVSSAFEKNAIVIFDEAHNIDNVCLEALSVDLDRRALDRASRNLTVLNSHVSRIKQADKSRLDAEYRRLVNDLRSSADVPSVSTGQSSEQQLQLGNPTLPDAILEEAIPGSIRKAEHFISFIRRFVEYLRTRISIGQVESQSPQAFLHHLNQAVAMDTKPMRFCYSRLNSLLRTLEITNLEEFNPIARVADFATLVSTYANGFMVLVEPFSSHDSNVPDPLLQLVCLDPSLAIQPVFQRFSSVIITSGTLSPIDLYPKLLNFHPVVRESLPMSVYRACICPLVVTRGSDQMNISTKFDLRDDLSVVRNYGTLLLEMTGCVPDGLVCFFPSYLYMENIISQWDTLGVLKKVLNNKLIFIESKDVVETTLALDNFKRACDCGRGGVFFSIARGKVAEGIDFDRHYGRAVILFGIPFQYTLSHVLRARLEYLRYTHHIKESDFLTFDALRQAAQCAGRVIRSKADYGIIIFADSRYNRYDKRTKLPPWIIQFLSESHLNLSVDMAIHLSKKYLLTMAQPCTDDVTKKSILLDEEHVQKRLDVTNKKKNHDSITAHDSEGPLDSGGKDDAAEDAMDTAP